MYSLIGKSYQTIQDLKAAVNDVARQYPFAVSTKNSNKRSLTLQCVAGGAFRNNHHVTEESRKRVRTSFRTDCPWNCKAYRYAGSDSWTILKIHDEHNHPFAPDARVYHQ
ncbi:uncharacterized protein BYT42DRAFT_481825, partial [Radiomyces spectabilis]|uniref:uncharacterized protein n=1 Tax=Radiomyces spectabilis TaxID=64574 RepID=UPI0022206E0B